jgi:hypothetical protein
VRAGFGLDEGEGGFGLEARPIGTVGAERIEDVTDLDESAGVVATAFGLTVRIPGSIEPTMVFVGDDGGEVKVAFAFNEDASALDGVAFDNFSLIAGELAGFDEYIAGDPDLSDVVEQSADAECSGVCRFVAERFGECGRENGDVAGVSGGVLVELL